MVKISIKVVFYLFVFWGVMYGKLVLNGYGIGIKRDLGINLKKFAIKFTSMNNQMLKLNEQEFIKVMEVLMFIQTMWIDIQLSKCKFLDLKQVSYKRVNNSSFKSVDNINLDEWILSILIVMFDKVDFWQKMKKPNENLVLKLKTT